MGDDLIDIPLLRRVGFAVVVPNAVSHVIPYAHYVTRAEGGRGACREVCELLLRRPGFVGRGNRTLFRRSLTVRVPRRLAQGLALTFVLGLTMVLVVGIWKGRTQKEQQAVQTTAKSDAEMRLGDMEYTELQEGKHLWTIRAAEAKYFQEEQKTLLSSVRITFFLENGEEIQLGSQEGALYAGTKDIALWGAVQAVLPRGYQLSTERAFYDHQKKDHFFRNTGSPRRAGYSA